MRWLRRAAIALGVLAVVSLGAIWWLFYDNRLPHDGTFPLDRDALRAEAARLPGPGPLKIEVEELWHTFVPKAAMVAGTDWSKIDQVRASYRLVWPDRTMVVDTANSLALARRFHSASYDTGAWARMQRALDRADAIIVTHEHADHIGGLIESPHLPAILPHAVLNPQQVEGEQSDPLAWPSALFARFRPLDYRGVRAIAPGVVLIRAPGHTPGSQMVYVRRADGREFLFMGDAASNMDNVRLERIRSRYVTTYFGEHRDDRHAVMLQTMALHRLSLAHPDIVLIPGHDAAAIRDLQRRGLLVRGFR